MRSRAQDAVVWYMDRLSMSGIDKYQDGVVENATRDEDEGAEHP